MHIFTLCLPEGDKPLDLTLARMSLIRVCRAWRTIAIDTPQLWTDIRLPPNDSRLLQPSTLRTWLRWSHGRPLTLALRADCSVQLETEFVRVFVEFCAQWRDVSFMLLHEKSANTLGDSLRPQLENNDDRNILPILCEFTFDLRDGFGMDGTVNVRRPWSVSLHHALSVSSNLQTLSIGNWGSIVWMSGPPFTPPTFVSALHHLKIIEEHRPKDHTRHNRPEYNLGNLFRFLHGCANLVSLTLVFDFGELVHPPPPNTVVHLVRLQKLKILTVGVEALAAFVSPLHVPNVSTLTLDLLQTPGSDAMDIFGSIIRRLLQDCGPTLRDLTLHVDHIFADDINREMLASLPVLSSLTIGAACSLVDWSNIFTLLTYDFGARERSFPLQNTLLEHFVFELELGPDHMMSEDYPPEVVNGFLISLAKMVCSRRAEALPRNLESIVGGMPVRVLSVVGMGRNLVDMYTRSESCRIPGVRVLWDLLAKFVDCRPFSSSLVWQEPY